MRIEKRDLILNGRSLAQILPSRLDFLHDLCLNWLVSLRPVLFRSMSCFQSLTFPLAFLLMTRTV